MENDPFIDDVPMNISIYSGFAMALLNNQIVRTQHANVCVYIYIYIFIDISVRVVISLTYTYIYIYLCIR